MQIRLTIKFKTIVDLLPLQITNNRTNMRMI